MYQAREVVVTQDGVELLLDFKEQPNTPPDAPILFILHGIGARACVYACTCAAACACVGGWVVHAFDCQCITEQRSNCVHHGLARAHTQSHTCARPHTHTHTHTRKRTHPGGGSFSDLAMKLSDLAAANGWRAVVYNRRGHGESTLLPAPLVPVRGAQAAETAHRVCVCARASRACVCDCVCVIGVLVQFMSGG